MATSVEKPYPQPTTLLPYLEVIVYFIVFNYSGDVFFDTLPVRINNQR